MSESTSRKPIDFDEFERRLRGLVPPAAASSPEDRMAELARIVGRKAERTEPVFSATQTPAPDERWSDAPDFSPLRGSFDDHQVGDARRDDRDPYAGEGYANEAAAQASAESWTDDQRGPVPAFLTGEEAEPRRSRKALYLMSAALVVVLGGIGATFAFRSGALGLHDIPTIKAATGPSRVQPERGDDAPAQSASVLDKGGDKVTTSRVVNSTEQPVDLSQAARAQRVPTPVQVVSPSPNLPEARRVRTVTVRPDGTIVSADATPAAASALPVAAPATPAASTPAATPSTPRVNPVTSAASGTSPATAAPPPTPTVRPVAKPSPRVADAAKPDAPTTINDLSTRVTPPAPSRPARVAATDPVPTASTSGAGGFGVQLAAPGSEQDARDAVTRLQQKFASELGGNRLGWQKAESNGRTVYRVRANGLSRDDATSLCSKLQAGGGSCFVARN